VGSGYLTGTEDEKHKFLSAKTEAQYLCDHMLSVKFPYEIDNVNVTGMKMKHLTYWSGVKHEITIMDFETFKTKTSAGGGA
jgi:hypothetical protein